MDTDTKEMKVMPRVLVSTVAQWSDVGADTWSLLLSKYDVTKVASLYIRAAKSKSPMCHRYFHIFEDRVMKSIFFTSTKTGEEYRYVAGESSDTEEEVNNEEKESSRYNQYKKHRSWIMYLAREVVWKLGRWKSKELDTFLDDFNPEVLVFPIESYIHLNRINRYIIEKKHPKVIGFFNDDNFTYKQGKGFGFKLRRFWLRRSVKWLVAHCDTVFAVCPKMKRECDEEFGIDSIWLSKAMAVQNDFVQYSAGDPIRLCYTGKLYINRDKTLISLANAVHKINADRVRVVLDIFSTSALSEEVIRQLECDPGCHFRGAIPYSQVFDEQKKSDILLFVEDLSPDHLEARLSFSTKITDYFGSGKCLWAIGNADLGPIEYIKSQEAGLVSTSESEIYDVLKGFVDNPEIISHYARNGYEVGCRYHNAELITATFMDTIAKLMI